MIVNDSCWLASHAPYLLSTSCKLLKKAIESASMIAKYTQEDPFNGLAPKDRMAWNIPDLDLYHPWNLEAQQSVDIAKECEQSALEQDEIDNSDGAELSSYEGETYYANSNGPI